MKKIVLLSFALSASMMVLASSAKSPQENVVPMSSDNRVEMAGQKSFLKVEPATKLEAKPISQQVKLRNGATAKAEGDAPFAFYNRPAGAYFWGITRGFGKYPMPILLDAAYNNAIWPNLSADATSFLWKYADPYDFVQSPKVLESTDKDLSVYYPNFSYSTPTLTATSNIGTTEYQMKGSKGNAGVYFTGGDATIDDKEYIGVSSKDYSDGGTYYMADVVGDWWFGTGPTAKQIGIYGMATFMEKPSHPYILKSMYALAYNFEADADAELTVTIKELDSAGNVVGIIATGVCLGGDAVILAPDSDGGSIVNLPFAFEKIDESTGLSEEITPTINSSIMVEFTGYQDPKVKSMSLMVSANNTPDSWGETGYFICTDAEGDYYFPISKFFKNPLYTAPSLFMDITYTWFESEEDTFTAPNAGGSKTFDVECIYTSAGWVAEEEEAGTLPSWIQITKEGNSNPQKLTFTVDALPSDVEGRSFDVTMSIPGASKVYKISQGVSGVNDAVVNSIKVANVGGDFAVTYPATVNAVKIFNIAGQLVKDIALTNAGSTVIPAQELAKGIYIMQFNDNQKIKVIK